MISSISNENLAASTTPGNIDYILTLTSRKINKKRSNNNSMDYNNHNNYHEDSSLIFKKLVENEDILFTIMIPNSHIRFSSDFF